MIPDSDARRAQLQRLVLWVAWSSNLIGLGLLYLVLHEAKAVNGVTPANQLFNLAGFLPLFVSIIIRWLVLPRATQPGPLLVMFVVGVALAEACGILGLLIGGPYRESLFVLGVLGVTSFVPIFAKRQMEPKGSGFIPNN